MTTRKVCDLFRRTREIWIAVYAFLAGLNCGRANVWGFALIVVGGAAILVYVARLQRLALGRDEDTK